MPSPIPEIFDYQQLIRQKNRANPRFAAHQFLFEEAANLLGDHLDCLKRDYQQALNLYAFNDCLHNQLVTHHKIKNITTCSALPDSLTHIQNVTHTPLEAPLLFDAKQFDLITSSMGLHWLNDLPGVLIQTLKALRPDGLFLFNMLGAGTLDELRLSLAEADKQHYGGMAARIIPFVEVKTLGMLLQRAGFEMPIADTETITVHYPNLKRLMHDLRYMGEGNALVKRSKKPISKAWLNTAEEYYRQHFSDGEDGLVAHFEIITATALAPA